MDVQPIDLRDEIGQGVQPFLAGAPVIFRPPITRDRLNDGELHSLRKIGDGFLLGQPRGLDAPTQIGHVSLWKLHLKRTKSGPITHGYAPFCKKKGQPSVPAATVAAAPQKRRRLRPSVSCMTTLGN